MIIEYCEPQERSYLMMTFTENHRGRHHRRTMFHFLACHRLTHEFLIGATTVATVATIATVAHRLLFFYTMVLQMHAVRKR